MGGTSVVSTCLKVTVTRSSVTSSARRESTWRKRIAQLAKERKTAPVGPSKTGPPQATEESEDVKAEILEWCAQVPLECYGTSRHSLRVPRSCTSSTPNGRTWYPTPVRTPYTA